MVEKIKYQVVEISEVGVMEDDEFIAVITAAIAASLKRTAHSIIVRSIQQTPTTSPVWNRAARYDLTANKL